MAFLLSVPLSIVGYGDDPYALTGLMLGLGVPAVLFSLYIDNVAVCERKKVFDTLQRSLELVLGRIGTALWFFLVCALMTAVLSFLGAFMWGMLLADRFTQFIGMNLTEQQELFSQYTINDCKISSVLPGWLSLQ
jgi:MFS family permease